MLKSSESCHDRTVCGSTNGNQCTNKHGYYYYNKTIVNFVRAWQFLFYFSLDHCFSSQNIETIVKFNHSCEKSCMVLDAKLYEYRCGYTTLFFHWFPFLETQAYASFAEFQSLSLVNSDLRIHIMWRCDQDGCVTLWPLNWIKRKQTINLQVCSIAVKWSRLNIFYILDAFYVELCF